MIADRERWVDIDEAAAYLSVSVDTVRLWIKNKGMPSRKIGRRWKFKLDEIDNWVESGKSAIDG